MASFRDLKVGSKVRIVGVPGEGDPGYWIHKDTIRAYKKIIARKRPVRIYKIDEWGLPWYCVRLRRKNGKWEWHFLNVMEDDTNWVPVKPRKAKRTRSAS